MARKKRQKPPGWPWEKLDSPEKAWGYASVYLSDDLARYPVRDVTRPGDNKSDPNIETLTYGLCSTCEPNMRTSIVQRGVPYVFFITNHRGSGRALTGFYELGWYAKGPLSEKRIDYSLAAKRGKFISPIPIKTLRAPLRKTLGTGFRLSKLIPPQEARLLLTIISSAEDQTQRYRAEIDRLESFALRHTGFRYPTWRRTDPWDWPSALRYLEPAAAPEMDLSKNTSSTGRWKCTACGEIIDNAARLKACPACGRLATLVPSS